MPMAARSLKTNDVRIVRRQLQFRDSSMGAAELVRLPFGAGINAQDYRFRRQQVGRTWEIRAYPKGQSSGHYTILAPSYYAHHWIKDPQTGSKLGLKLWTVQSDLDHLASRQVIQRVHYLSDSGRGMILACAFEDPDAQVAVRKRAQRPPISVKRLDPSWLLPAGGIIGCAVLDTLLHGNPIAGRSEIASALHWPKTWTGWSRSEIVRKMRVAWGSRFAVDRPYQALGIGTVLAKHLKKVARRYRAPSADFLEVITTRSKDDEASEKRDSLIQAGYVRMFDKMESNSMMVMNLSTGYREPKSAVKYYYFADLRHE